MRQYKIVAFVLSLLFPCVNIACSCGQRSDSLETDVKLNWGASTAVVSAQVVSVEYHTAIQHGVAIQMQKATWRVLQSWKGSHPVSSLVSTDTEVTCCLCGVSVGVGESRLLYLESSEPYRVNECSIGGSLNTSAAQIPFLNKLRAAALK